MINKRVIALCVALLFPSISQCMQKKDTQVLHENELVFDKKDLCNVSGKLLKINSPFKIVSTHMIKRAEDCMNLAFYAHIQNGKKVTTKLAKGDQVLFDDSCFLQKILYKKNKVTLISIKKDPKITVYRTSIKDDLIQLRDRIKFRHVIIFIFLCLTSVAFLGQNNK